MKKLVRVRYTYEANAYLDFEIKKGRLRIVAHFQENEALISKKLEVDRFLISTTMKKLL